ncbi:MAG: hypothetical protein WCX23_02540 [Candidatus Paceibacterota bacterium]|jgi:cell division protein FtsB|nr:hypothetical protein [Candidatus Paceibacterota bacterium]MDD4830906.1 hypothetical protein [Candidatus Paceibacterota bacterium]MDD4875020.1 hypothetical protein [Candidatus Paceibacterota bacterium]
MIAKKQKIKKSFFTPKNKRLVLVFLLLLPIIYLAETNLNLNQERKKLIEDLEQTKKTLADSIDKENRLNNLLSHISSSQALEKVAREDLNLQKPGEKILVVKNEDDMQKQGEGSSQKEETGFSFGNIIDWIKEKTGI